jgi:uncharacterized protein YcbK (DUF882 family)
MTGKIQHIHPTLLDILVDIEEKEKLKLNITSGKRDPEKNAQVGGVQDSEHTYGQAEGADIACPDGATRWKLVTAALARGVVRIGIGKTFVHLGIAKDKPQRVMWHYY